MRKTIIFIILTSFLLNVFVPPSLAQTFMPQPGSMVSLSAPWQPSVLAGVKVYPQDPFRFDFILDPGNEAFTDLRSPASAGAPVKVNELVKYFLAALTTPEKDMWVNLSPYEKDRIVPEAFGQTGMGRDLLAQDYLLKQITASLMYPEGETGKVFWARIYAMAQEKFGTTDIPVDTFNKVWIVPGKAKIFSKNNTAYVVESRLKVMLETDYLAQTVAEPRSPALAGGSGQVAKDVLRAVIVPVLEQEINEGRNFAPLRQVYNSFILATWFKRHLKESILGQVYMDQSKISGVDIADKDEKLKIYAQYVEAFKKGAYNYIKEELDPATGETGPRKYVSGGVEFAEKMNSVYEETDAAQIPLKQVLNVSTRIAPADASQAGPERARAAFDPLFKTALFKKIMDDVLGEEGSKLVYKSFSYDGTYSLFTEDVWAGVADIAERIDALSGEEVLQEAEQGPLKNFNQYNKYQKARDKGLQVYEKVIDFLQATWMVGLEEKDTYGLDYYPAQLLNTTSGVLLGQVEMLEGDVQQESFQQVRSAFEDFYVLMKAVKVVNDRLYWDIKEDDDGNVHWNGYIFQKEGIDSAYHWADMLNVYKEYLDFVEGDEVLSIGPGVHPEFELLALLLGGKATFVQPGVDAGLLERFIKMFFPMKIRDMNGNRWDTSRLMQEEKIKIINDVLERADIDDGFKEKKFKVVTLLNVLDAHKTGIGSLIRASLGHLQENGRLVVTWHAGARAETYAQAVDMVKQIARDEFRLELRSVDAAKPIDLLKINGGAAKAVIFEAVPIDGAQNNVPAVKGGIDLNAEKMVLEESGHQVKFDVMMDPKQFESVPGFRPEIVSITPIADLSVFLGVK